MSHTPAPWSYEIHRGYVCIVHQGGSIGSAHDSKLNGETLPMEANGRLMAAAPDLLAALENLIENAQPVNWDDDDDPDQAETWRAAFRAVCKAKGLPVPKDMEAKS